MRNIILRPGESITIGDTVISVDGGDVEPTASIQFAFATARWQSVVADLMAAGWTQAKITDTTGVAQSTVSALGTGKRNGLSYESGVALLTLHRQVCGTGGGDA